MRRLFFLINVLLLAFSCNSKSNNHLKDDALPVVEDGLLSEKIKYQGVVMILPDSIEFLKDSILIRDKDGTVFNRLFFDDEENLVKFQDENIDIREYYPDYSIIIFDGFPLKNGTYEVLVNNNVYFLEYIEGYTIFEKWEDHIKRTFISTSDSNPLREFSSDTSEIISNLDYENLNFVVFDVKEDWIYVECDINCEGCPGGQLVKGWIRWRKGNKLIVKLHYVC